MIVECACSVLVGCARWGMLSRVCLFARGTIVNRTYGTHTKRFIFPYLF